MLYLERVPRAPLAPFVRMFWYAQAPALAPGRERILPNGCIQLIVNLARDYLLDCSEVQPDQKQAPALVVGCRSIYEVVDRSDMADLIGIMFAPGGLARFLGAQVDKISNCSVPLEDFWGSDARFLREQLLQAQTHEERFQCLENLLLQRLADSRLQCNRARCQTVQFALERFKSQPSMSSVSETARSLGWSERRFSQVFREHVGFSPKIWCRIERFQRAVRMLHKGSEIAWSELALDCGFYDQSHFANEFRAFSGVDATTYSAQRTRWTNHISVG